MDNAKAMKLLRLIDLLAPSIVGNIRDIDEAIAALLRTPDNRLEAPFDANCPLHIILKDISVNVIDFMKSIPKIGEEHTPRDKMCRASVSPVENGSTSNRAGVAGGAAMSPVENGPPATGLRGEQGSFGCRILR